MVSLIWFVGEATNYKPPTLPPNPPINEPGADPVVSKLRVAETSRSWDTDGAVSPSVFNSAQREAGGAIQKNIVADQKPGAPANRCKPCQFVGRGHGAWAATRESVRRHECGFGTDITDVGFQTGHKAANHPVISSLTAEPGIRCSGIKKRCHIGRRSGSKTTLAPSVNVMRRRVMLRPGDIQSGVPTAPIRSWRRNALGLRNSGKGNR